MWTGTGCALDDVPDPWDDDDPDEDYSEVPSCLDCGPECHEWMGDGLCAIALASEVVKEPADDQHRNP
jgi:hypothetical protein